MKSNSKCKLSINIIIISCFIISASLLATRADADGECGDKGGGARCPEGMCCSNYGYCGSTSAYCDPDHCHSQCPTPSPSPPLPPSPPIHGDVSDIITKELFEKMLLHRNENKCPAHGFYTYDAFITAARAFPGFGTTGTLETRKRELAAFFGQTSHETRGGWPSAPDGEYAWGYCHVRELDQSDIHCSPSQEWPCVAGQKYYGRGPIQISYNYNYGPAGKAIGLGTQLLSNPDLVATDATVSFKTAIWFWMTPQYNKPSCHNVIVGAWTPSAADKAANRLPGYGVLTNIINGGVECGPENARNHDSVLNRIGFFQRYCVLLGVGTGDYLDCSDQKSFAAALSLMNIIPRSSCYGALEMPVDQA